MCVCVVFRVPWPSSLCVCVCAACDGQKLGERQKQYFIQMMLLHAANGQGTGQPSQEPSLGAGQRPA